MAPESARFSYRGCQQRCLTTGKVESTLLEHSDPQVGQRGAGVEEQLLRSQTVSYLYIRILELILKYRFVNL